MITRASTQCLPDQPGVYFFMKGDTPIYIGKSVNIRARVHSHIQASKLSRKEYAIVSQADAMDYMTTLNNFDAIVLESQLIQKHKPQYNVVWKDDKHFLYIKINLGETYPKLIPVRKEEPDGRSVYFGPFKSSQMTEKLLLELRRIVPFCTQRALGKRPCFYARLGYCNPCPNAIESCKNPDEKIRLRKQYRHNIRKAIEILDGRTTTYMQSLSRQLKTLSDAQRYEEAILIRRKLLQFSLFLNQRSFHENRSSINSESDDIHEQVQEFMTKHFAYTLDPHAFRIECYDMSNLYGKQATGSLVVFQDGLFAKKEYRTFSVKYDGISDIHMMEEVLRRRLEHDEWRKPDLIVLDGGRPQLRHIDRLFRSLGVTIPLISIAKRPDRILLPKTGYAPIHVDKNSLFFKVIQSLRDESHRFAKKYHVALRDRKLLQ